MKTSLFILIGFLSLSVQALDVVTVKHSVVLDAPIDKVCEFITNPLNDDQWRSEVNDMTIEGGVLEVGAVIAEDAWIGLRRNFITKTRVEILNCPDEALFITTNDNPFYLRSHRYFESIDESSTRFTYDVEFDVKMIPATLGGNWNPDFVSSMYGIQMKRYLNKLKTIVRQTF